MTTDSSEKRGTSRGQFIRWSGPKRGSAQILLAADSAISRNIPPRFHALVMPRWMIHRGQEGLRSIPKISPGGIVRRNTSLFDYSSSRKSIQKIDVEIQVLLCSLSGRSVRHSHTVFGGSDVQDFRRCPDFSEAEAPYQFEGIRRCANRCPDQRNQCARRSSSKLNSSPARLSGRHLDKSPYSASTPLPPSQSSFRLG